MNEEMETQESELNRLLKVYSKYCIEVKDQNPRYHFLKV